MNILVVEDEVRLADTLAHMLKTQKFNCDVVYDGADGLAYGETGIYDCILLDIMLPKMDGFEVVRHLPLSETLEHKLPQRKLCTTAAAGYSSYGTR